MSGVPALVAENLTVRLGGRVILDNVSFAIAPRELCALIGPNGAGKTTLLNVLSGHLRPAHGKVFLDGKRIDRIPAHRLPALGLARTFQIATTFPSLTSVECIAAVLSGRLSLGIGGLKQRAPDFLSAAGISVSASRASALSQGDVKKLDLAIALASSPTMLLLDEPTAGVGFSERNNLLEVVLKHRADGNLTVLFSEHDTDVVFSIASRVLVLNRGQLIDDGAPQDIRRSALVRDVYLGEPV